MAIRVCIPISRIHIYSLNASEDWIYTQLAFELNIHRFALFSFMLFHCMAWHCLHGVHRFASFSLLSHLGILFQNVVSFA